eukprot:886079-Rhodomonas_salina.2
MLLPGSLLTLAPAYGLPPSDLRGRAPHMVLRRCCAVSGTETGRVLYCSAYAIAVSGTDIGSVLLC